MGIDTLAGTEESTAQQLVIRRTDISRCIASGEIGFVSTSIFTPTGTKKLSEDDFGGISEYVLGVFKDDTGNQLVVDCSSKEGFRNPRSVANNMAALLYHKLNQGGREWPGDWISSAGPAPVSTEGPDTRRLEERRSHLGKLQLLQTDPSRVTPLLFSKRI